MKPRLPPALACFVVLLVSSLLSVASASPDQSLFVIGRSKNANVVRYDVQLQKDGSLDLDHPIDAYWVMLAEDGRREELTWIERQLAYGWDLASEARDRGFGLKLVALPGRPLHVHREPSGRYRAITKIGDEQAVLERVFVQSEEGHPLPRVVYVDLFGSSVTSHAPVSERIVP